MIPASLWPRAPFSPSCVSMLRRHAWDDLQELCVDFDQARAFYACDPEGYYSFVHHLCGGPYDAEPPPQDVLPDLDAGSRRAPIRLWPTPPGPELNAHRFALY